MDLSISRSPAKVVQATETCFDFHRKLHQPRGDIAWPTAHLLHNSFPLHSNGRMSVKGKRTEDVRVNVTVDH